MGMNRNESLPIAYDFSRLFVPRHGISRESLRKLAPALEAARTEALADVDLWRSGKDVPQEKDPLDAGFIDLPDRLLREYQADREKSELARILTAARSLSEKVDRVVVLGIGGSYMGARALMDACAHPYHNELSRADRGSRPRIYFDGNNVDNDATQGLLDLLGRGRASQSVDDAWGVAVISKSGGTLETAVALRAYLRSLSASCGGDGKRLAERLVAITGPSGKLFDLAGDLGCASPFLIPDGVGGRFSIFTAVGLFPAALLGLDVVALLQGAAEANRRFREAPISDNPALDYTAACHLMERDRGAVIRVLSIWSKGLEAAGMWYDQLLSESLGKGECGATPLTAVNTRDLHSRGQQHQEGRRDKLITNLIVDQTRREPVAVGRLERDRDQLNRFEARTLPDIMSAALRGTNAAYEADGRPTADFHLPRQDEYSLGQFFQTMMLATVVEGRLVGINPYGQPGVQGYKQRMEEILAAECAKENKTP